MKKLILFLVCAFVVLTSFGQTTTENSKFFDNTYVGVYGQVSSPLTFDQTFPINPGVGVKLGKWVTPALGFNIDCGLLFGSAVDGDLRYSLENSVRALNLGVNLQVDMFNLFKYKEDRLFTIIPEVGLGWCHGFNTETNDVNDFSAKTGIQCAFNLGTNHNWQLYIEPAILWDLTGNYGSVQLAKNNSQLAIQVGVNYKFKNSDGTYGFTEYDIDALNANINYLRASLNEKPTEIYTEAIVTDTCYIPLTTVVCFAQGSSEIEDYDDLNAIPEGTTVDVYGFASPEGTVSFNQKLSEARANEVATYLESRSITVNKIQGNGVNGNTSNRIVIVKTK